VPFDLIELGTKAAMLALAPDDAEPVLELAAAELVAVDDDELLLLPHPAIAAALSSVTATETQVLRVRIALLLVRFQS
jgi:hypothetical protein